MKKPTTAVIFLLVGGILAVFVAPKLLRVRNLEARSARLEVELNKIQYENRLLENELRLLREDPVYLERVARKKFHKAKEGEIVYKIQKDPPASTTG